MGALCCGGTAKSTTSSTGGEGDGHDLTSGDKKKAQPPETPKRPHMFEEIVATWKPTPTTEEVYDGVLLAGKTKKYWVDERNKHNHFMLFPRGLSITGSEDPRYWTWQASDDVEVETASLKEVSWLDIRGKQELAHLTPGITYELFFDVMLTKSAEGWDDVPLKLAIKFPDGTTQQREEELHDKPRGQWLELKAGEVTARKGKTGEMEVSMSEHDTHWKKGLVLKGIKIIPKA